MGPLAQWRVLWRRQPALQALAAGIVLLHGLSGMLQLATWVRQLHDLARVWATLPNAPAPWPPRGMADAPMLALNGLAWLLGLVQFGLWAWLVRGLARAYTRPTRPIAWSELFHRAWEPVVRLLAGFGVSMVLNGLLYAVALVLMMGLMVPAMLLAAFLDTPVPIILALLLLGVIGLVGMVLWFPWSLNLVLTPVLQDDTAYPPVLLSRWWHLTRRSWRNFLPLALAWAAWLAGYFVLMSAVMLLPLRTMLPPFTEGASVASVPAWLWPLAFAAFAVAAVVQVGLLSLWVVMYLDHHPRDAAAATPLPTTGG